ncbi:MAG: hypothetical protein ACK46X_04755 [Candidatus Sericytochromatia bacterium]
MATDGPTRIKRRMARIAVLAMVLGLAGCRAPGAMPPPAAFVIDPVGPAAVTQPQAATGQVRLHGYATVPVGVKDLANVQDGRVSGSPVRIQDVATGRTLAQGVTYYDGSFQVDVPIPGTQRAVIVVIDLVDRADRDRTTPLEAPLMLRAGVTTSEISLNPGTTALSAFLARLAEEQSDAAPDSIGMRAELGGLIAAFEPETQTQFAMLAEKSPELAEAHSLTGFETGIQAYVGRLTSRMTVARKPTTKTGAKLAYAL